MDKVLQVLSTTIIDESVKAFYQQIFTIIPNIYILKSQTTNYFEFINSITDSALLTELKQIDLLSLNLRLKNVLYYESNGLNTNNIIFNQNLLMLWLIISTSNDIVIKNKTNESKLLLLSPENIVKLNQTQNQIIDIGIVKYKTDIFILQMNTITSQLVINGSSNAEIMDVIKNILTN
jgi:hypothetical protein